MLMKFLLSYSHMDKDRVFGIIRLLQGRGYRVWFDEGKIRIEDHQDDFGAVIRPVTESELDG